MFKSRLQSRHWPCRLSARLVEQPALLLNALPRCKRRRKVAQRRGSRNMSQTRSSGDSAATVRIIPPDIVRRRIVAWGGVRAEVLELIRRDQFEYKFHAPHHLLIMSERTSRDDG